MTTPGFFDSLERQLGDGFDRAGHRRASRRRLLQRAGGIAAGVLVLLTAFAFVSRDDPAAAGVSIEQRDGLVYVRLTDVEYRADAIEDAARVAGLDIEVESVPTGPSLIGRFVRASGDGIVGKLKELDPDGPAFSGFVIPAGFDGSLSLQVGRPSKDGEPYAQYGNALSEGEPLACTGIVGVTPAEAVEIIHERNIDAVWTLLTARGMQSVDPSSVDDGVHVARAMSTAPDHVQIVLTDDATPLADLEATAPATC
jgi:hypothetical protein